jgi:hypothetical protein
MQIFLRKSFSISFFQYFNQPQAATRLQNIAINLYFLNVLGWVETTINKILFSSSSSHSLKFISCSSHGELFP